MQKAIDKIREELKVDIKVHGERIGILRFADDIVIMTESEQGIQRIVSTMDGIMEKDFNMIINKQK